MQNEIFYLDHNATTPVHSDVVQAMTQALVEYHANPSSTHTMGRRVRAKIEDARAQVAKAINAPAREIIFTSGGTEADNLALLGHEYTPGDLVVSTSIEHPAIDNVLEYLRELEVHVEFVQTNSEGIIDFEHFKSLVALKPRVISFMWGHNETGVIQDIEKLSNYVAAFDADKEIFFHTDGVQTLGRFDGCHILPGLSSMSLSSHKINGPKGVGALWVRGGRELIQRQLGGSQEREMRPGTENVPGVIGFGAAAELWSQKGSEFREEYSQIRNDFESRLEEALPGILIHGRERARLVNTSCISFPGLEADILLLGLDMAGIQASAGSACAAGAVKSSRVIKNLGYDESVAKATLRFSFGLYSKIEDNALLVEKIANLVQLGGGLRLSDNMS